MDEFDEAAAKAQAELDKAAADLEAIRILVQEED
jgi:hypothetical protein